MWLRFLRGSSRILIAVALCVFATAVAAQEMKPAANVLLPYFEIRLPGDDSGTAVATAVAIANASAIPTEVEITVYTNWGIPVLEFSDTLRRAQPRAIDLEEWIGHGRLPGRTLAASELDELHAALTGRPSPTDHLYRGTADEDGLAVGYLIARATGERREVLWGDTYGIDAATDSFRGDTLATVNDLLEADCSRHAVRFINRDSLYKGTELILWTGRRFEPSPTTEPIGSKVKVVGGIYDDEGNHIADCMRDVVAVQVIEACSMPNLPASGWIDVVLDQPAFVQQHLHAVTAASAELHAWCLPEDLSLKDGTASISLDKYVNHLDADRSPGADVKVGDALHFTYAVWNSGALPLRDIVVTDSEGLEVQCPASTLEPGKWMDCTAPAVKALGCIHKTSATVVARSAVGEVTDTDPAWYKASFAPAVLTLEAFANGRKASPPDLPYFAANEQVTHTVRVTNTGQGPAENIGIDNISVDDPDQTMRTGPDISCPATSLAAGSTMTCTGAAFSAKPGTTKNLARFRWNTRCGESGAATTSVSSRVPAAAVRLRKLINSHDADTPEDAVHADYGDTLAFTYRVLNIGDFPLHVTVTDDVTAVVVNCPQPVVPAFQFMTCTASGAASAGLWNQPAAVLAITEGGDVLQATDEAWYFGATHPAIDLESFIQSGPKEYDADDPGLPIVFAAGSSFTVRYVVTNTGDSPLEMVGVADNTVDHPLCTVNMLPVGESTSCTRTVQALPGNRSHTIRAFGTALQAYGGARVEDYDPIHYLGNVD